MTRYTAKLSPADQVCPHTHSPVTGCYRHANPERAYELMAAGLKEMVRRVPYLAGYIERGEQGYTHLHWSDQVTGDEVELEKLDGTRLPTYQQMAEAGLNLTDYDFDFNSRKSLTREFLPRDREPALVVAFTVLRGGFIVSFANSHQFTDAIAQVDLLCYWAAITAGEDFKIKFDPLGPLKRYDTFVDATGLEPSPFHKPSNKTEQRALTERISDDLTREQAPNPNAREKPIELKRKLFALSYDSLEELRKAIQEDSGSRPSRFAVVSALFWCLITDVRQRRGTTERPSNGDPPRTNMVLTTEARISFPKMDRHYVGNFISPGFATDEVTEVAQTGTTSKPYPAGLAHTCDLLTSAVLTALDPDTIRPKLQMISNIPDARLLAAAGGNPMGANDILLTAWVHFNVYPYFGREIGSNECWRAGATGKFTNRQTYSYIIPLPPRKGSDGKTIIEVFCCFEKGDMEELERHGDLQRWLYKEPTFANSAWGDFPAMMSRL